MRSEKLKTEKLLSLRKYPNFVRFHLPVFLWMALIFALSSVPGSALAPMEFPFAHPIAHSLLYATLCFLLYRAFGHQSFSLFLRRFRLIAALVSVAVWGASDEYHQSFTPGRTPEFKDFMIDVSAALVVSILIMIINRFRDRGEPSAVEVMRHR
jgi:VanZ family protein